jgi:hypothetical protein
MVEDLNKVFFCVSQLGLVAGWAPLQVKHIGGQTVQQLTTSLRLPDLGQ